MTFLMVSESGSGFKKNAHRSFVLFAACLLTTSGMLIALAAPEPAVPNTLNAPEHSVKPKTTPVFPPPEKKTATPPAAPPEKQPSPSPSKQNILKDPRTLTATTPDALPEQWGIQVLGVRQTAGGNMIDFRYKVLDPEKAGPLFDRNTQPYLIDETTEARLPVPNPPQVGPLRTTMPPKVNKIYCIIFANPGQCLKKDCLATLIIGDLKVEHLVLE